MVAISIGQSIEQTLNRLNERIDSQNQLLERIAVALESKMDKDEENNIPIACRCCKDRDGCWIKEAIETDDISRLDSTGRAVVDRARANDCDYFGWSE